MLITLTLTHSEWADPVYTLHALAGRVDPTWCGSQYPFSRELTEADVVQP